MLKKVFYELGSILSSLIFVPFHLESLTRVLLNYLKLLNSVWCSDSLHSNSYLPPSTWNSLLTIFPGLFSNFFFFFWSKCQSWVLTFSVNFSSVTQSCPSLCDPMDCGTPGLPVHHQLQEFTQYRCQGLTIESVMPSNHFILCHPLLLLPSIFPSIRVFSNDSVLLIRWP